MIQNELLQIIADLIRERITNDVRASGWYGIILDETSDISRTEQVSLCLSFALNGTKKEAFTGFYSTKSTEGEVLYELVKSSITELNLDLMNVNFMILSQNHEKKMIFSDITVGGNIRWRVGLSSQGQGSHKGCNNTYNTCALLGIFYPKEELKGRRLHDLVQDVVEAITGKCVKAKMMPGCIL